MSEARETLKNCRVELNVCVKTDQFHLISVSITLLQSCQALPKSIRGVWLGPLVSQCVSHVPYISHFLCISEAVTYGETILGPDKLRGGCFSFRT